MRTARERRHLRRAGAFVNALGMQSGWVTLCGFTVTSQAGVTTQIDHGAFITSAARNLDYGEFA